MQQKPPELPSNRFSSRNTGRDVSRIADDWMGCRLTSFLAEMNLDDPKAGGWELEPAQDWSSRRLSSPCQLPLLLQGLFRSRSFPSILLLSRQRRSLHTVHHSHSFIFYNIAIGRLLLFAETQSQDRRQHASNFGNWLHRKGARDTSYLYINQPRPAESGR